MQEERDVVWFGLQEKVSALEWQTHSCSWQRWEMQRTNQKCTFYLHLATTDRPETNRQIQTPDVDLNLMGQITTWDRSMPEVWSLKSRMSSNFRVWGFGRLKREILAENLDQKLGCRAGFWYQPISLQYQWLLPLTAYTEDICSWYNSQVCQDF